MLILIDILIAFVAIYIWIDDERIAARLRDEWRPQQSTNLPAFHIAGST